ncbi:MAG TPA: hypothetical protein VEB22_15070 [Phycisphaerales bacterium]|nr:hypothetical protein [Phycisphaerales bacterium]
MHIVPRAFSLLSLALTAGVHGQATFTGIGVLPGFDNSMAVGVSDDGLTVVGDMIPANFMLPVRGFRWNAGSAALAPLPGGYVGSRILGISGDGTTMIGSISTQPFGPNTLAAAWSGAFAATPLNPGGIRAMAVSGNGTVVAGMGYNSTFEFRAMRWNGGGGGGGGLIGPDVQTYAGAVNAAGDLIAGYANPPEGGSFAFVTGPAGDTPLPNPINGFALGVDGMNSAGTQVVGRGGFGDQIHTFLWSLDGPPSVQVLPNPFGAQASMGPAGITDAGVVVGSVDGGGTSGSFIWTTSSGTVRLEPVMTAYRADLSNWTSITVADISPDGRTLVGFGTHEVSPGVFRQEGWIFSSPVSVPAPACAGLLCGMICSAVRPRR